MCSGTRGVGRQAEVRPPYDGKVAERIQVIAHRGAHESAVENTLEAYRAAIELGCDYIEIDLRTAPDGRMLIKHNALEAGDVLPPFDEVLALAKGRIRIYLDVKQAMAASIVAAVERAGMRESIVTYGSFELLRDLVRLRPGWPVMPEAVNAGMLERSLRELKPPVVAFSGGDFRPELVKQARKAGCGVFLDRQGKTDYPEFWQQAVDEGVTGIQTDRPSALLAWLRGKGLHG